MLLRDDIRRMGMHICAGKGAGKSRLLAYILWRDFSRAISSILIDPTGQVI